MSPTTSEDELEAILEDKEEILKFVQLKIQSIKKKLTDAEEDFVSARLELDKVKEELRKFRLMYPSLCKRRT